MQLDVEVSPPALVKGATGDLENTILTCSNKHESFDLYMVYLKRYYTRALQPTKVLTSKSFTRTHLINTYSVTFGPV